MNENGLGGFFFSDAGRRIKNLAKIIFWLLLLIAVYTGGKSFIEAVREDMKTSTIFWRLFCLIYYCFSCWFFSLLLYGFGELIDRTDDNATNSKKIYQLMKEQQAKSELEAQNNVPAAPQVTHKWYCPHCGSLRTQSICEHCGKN